MGFSPQGGIDEIALKNPRDGGHNLQVDPAQLPTGADPLHSDGRGGFNLLRTEPGRSQFIGQTDRKAAGVRGGYQFRRIGCAPRAVGTKSKANIVKPRVRSSDGASTPASSEPAYGGGPSVGFQLHSNIRALLRPGQYLEKFLMML